MNSCPHALATESNSLTLTSSPAQVDESGAMSYPSSVPNATSAALGTPVEKNESVPRIEGAGGAVALDKDTSGGLSISTQRGTSCGGNARVIAASAAATATTGSPNEARNLLHSAVGSMNSAARALYFGDSQLLSNSSTPSRSSSRSSSAAGDRRELPSGVVGVQLPSQNQWVSSSSGPTAFRPQGYSTSDGVDTEPVMTSAAGDDDARYIGIASGRNFIIGARGCGDDVEPSDDFPFDPRVRPAQRHLSSPATTAGTLAGRHRRSLHLASQRQNSASSGLVLGSTTTTPIIGGSERNNSSPQRSPLNHLLLLPASPTSSQRQQPEAAAMPPPFRDMVFPSSMMSNPMPTVEQLSNPSMTAAASSPATSGRPLSPSPASLRSVGGASVFPSGLHSSPPLLPRSMTWAGMAAAAVSAAAATPSGRSPVYMSASSGGLSPLLVTGGFPPPREKAAAPNAIPYEEEQYRHALSYSLGLPTTNKATSVLSYRHTPIPDTSSSSANPALGASGTKVAGGSALSTGITVGGERSNSVDTTTNLSSYSAPPSPALDHAGVGVTGCVPVQQEVQDGMKTPVMGARSPAEPSQREPAGNLPSHCRHPSCGEPASLMLPPTTFSVAARAAGFSGKTQHHDPNEHSCTTSEDRYPQSNRCATPRDRERHQPPPSCLVFPQAYLGSAITAATPTNVNSSSSSNSTIRASATVSTPTATKTSSLYGYRSAAAVPSGKLGGMHSTRAHASATMAAALCTPVRCGDNDLCPLESRSCRATPMRSGPLASPLSAFMDDTFSTDGLSGTGGHRLRAGRTPFSSAVGQRSPRDSTYSGDAAAAAAGWTSSSLLTSTSAAPRSFALERKLNVSSLEMKLHRSPVHWGCLGLIVALQGGVHVLSSATETGKDRVLEIFQSSEYHKGTLRRANGDGGGGRGRIPYVTAVASTVNPSPAAVAAAVSATTSAATSPLADDGGLAVKESELVYVAMGLSDGTVLVQGYRLRSRASAVLLERKAQSATGTAIQQTTYFPLYCLPELVGELAAESAVPPSSAAPVTALQLRGHHLYVGDMAGILSIHDLRSCLAPSVLETQRQSWAPTASAASNHTSPRTYVAARPPAGAAAQGPPVAPERPTWIPPQVRKLQQQQQQRRGLSAPGEASGRAASPGSTGVGQTPTRRPGGVPVHHFTPTRVGQPRPTLSLSKEEQQQQQGHLAHTVGKADEGDRKGGAATPPVAEAISQKTNSAANMAESNLFNAFVAGTRAHLPTSPVRLHVGESIFHIAVTAEQDRIAVGTTHSLLVYHIDHLIAWGASTTTTMPSTGCVGGGSIRRPEPIVVVRHSARPVRAFDWLATPPLVSSSPSEPTAVSPLGLFAAADGCYPATGSAWRPTVALMSTPGTVAASGATRVGGMRPGPMLVFAGGEEASEVRVYALSSRRVIGRRAMGRPIHFLRCCPCSTDVMVSLEVGSEDTLRAYRDLGEDGFFLTNHSNNVYEAVPRPEQQQRAPQPPDASDLFSPTTAALHAATTAARTPVMTSMAVGPRSPDSRVASEAQETPAESASRSVVTHGGGSIASSAATPVTRLFPSTTTTSTSSATPVHYRTPGSSVVGSAVSASTAAHTPAAVSYPAPNDRDLRRVSHARPHEEQEESSVLPLRRTSSTQYSVPPAMPAAAATDTIQHLPSPPHPHITNNGDSSSASSSPDVSSIESPNTSMITAPAITGATVVADTRLPPTRRPPQPAAAPRATANAASPTSPSAPSCPPLPTHERAPLLHLEVVFSISEEAHHTTASHEATICGDDDACACLRHPREDRRNGTFTTAEDENEGGATSHHGICVSSGGGYTGATIRLRGYSDVGSNGAYIEDCVYGAFSPDCTSFVTAGPGTELERHARVWDPFKLGDDARKERVANAAVAATAIADQPRSEGGGTQYQRDSMASLFHRHTRSDISEELGVNGSRFPDHPVRLHEDKTPSRLRNVTTGLVTAPPTSTDFAVYNNLR